MKIAFHGGKCCGIKTIHGMGDNPSGSLPPLRKPRARSHQARNADQYGKDVSSKTNFFDQPAPAETYLERLDRYLAFLDAERPAGIVEITLADERMPDYCEDCGCNCWSEQTRLWRQPLEERGFKEVNNCLNSNSGNRVYVFHRNREDD